MGFGVWSMRYRVLSNLKYQLSTTQAQPIPALLKPIPAISVVQMDWKFHFWQNFNILEDVAIRSVICRVDRMGFLNMISLQLKGRRARNRQQACVAMFARLPGRQIGLERDQEVLGLAAETSPPNQDFAHRGGCVNHSGYCAQSDAGTHLKLSLKGSECIVQDNVRYWFWKLWSRKKVSVLVKILVLSHSAYVYYLTKARFKMQR